MNIQKILLHHTARLNSRLEAELLLAHVLQKPKSFLYAHPEYTPTPQEELHFNALIQKRLSGTPIAYLLGEKEFWSLPFYVNEHVLIPRPETELLVELALKTTTKEAVIADLGTGSGAIAIALKHERPQWTVIATDQSTEALNIAKRNAERNKNPIEFYQGNWCEALPSIQLDLIISNPPYIDPQDPHLTQGDLRFEPKSALSAENHGMADIETIAQQAHSFLKPQGWLMLEHGYQQSELVQACLRKNEYQQIETKTDLAGLPRVTIGQPPS